MITSDMNPLENCRYSYRPKICKVLLIGESAPAAGTFFYFGNSPLCTYTREAFTMAFPNANIANNNMQFLDYFRDFGFFLDDLCLVPVNNMENETRQQHNQENIPSLATRLREYQPAIIICIMLGIREYVRESLIQSGLSATTEFHAIPFGGNGQQGRYRQKLAIILRDLQHRNVININ